MPEKKLDGEQTTLGAILQHMLGLDERLRQHMDKEELGMKAINDKLEAMAVLTKAFPHVDGKPDIEGHYADHVTRMQIAATRKKRLDGVTQKILETAAVGVFCAVMVLLALGAKDWLQNAGWISSPQYITQITDPKDR